jgi:hypothetical protein
MNVSKGTPRVEIESTQSGVEAEQRLPRRGLLAAGIATGVGAAASLLPFLGGRASAATSSTTGDSSTTTTVPPKRPSEDDITLLAAALQIELTAQGLYARAVSSVDGWTEAQATVMVTLRQAHLAFGNSLSGLLGKSAPSTRDEALFNQWKADFTGGTDDVLKKAADLESALVASYLDVLAKLQGLNGAALVASIVTSEARHVTVLRDLAGVTDEGELLVDNEASSLLGNG